MRARPDGDDRRDIEHGREVTDPEVERLRAELNRLYNSPSWRVAQLFQRVRLEFLLLAHRVRHPVQTIRILASQWIPFQLRQSVLQVIPRQWRRSAQPRASARIELTAPDEGPDGLGRTRPLPVVICLPAIEWGLRVQRPQQLLTRLAGRGWPVLYAALDLAPGGGRVTVDYGRVAQGVRLFRLPSRKLRHVTASRLEHGEVKEMARGFAQLRRCERIREAVVFCESPVWTPLARLLKKAYGWPVVYDRMDLHTGFSTNRAEIGEQERILLAECDLAIASAHGLSPHESAGSGRVLLLPNACDPLHWEDTEPAPEVAALPNPVIGYFGSVSEWFDTQLVTELALARPSWSFVLVGSTWGADVSRLERLSNVTLLGERSYRELPAMAAGFDVGMIPFRKTPLTAVTNPVKVYEMLAAGLKVVGTRLEEMGMFPPELVSLADGKEEFLESIEAALRDKADSEARAARRTFARNNTWESRVDELETALRELFPRVSIAIVTRDHRELTELCLQSIRGFTAYPNYEVVFVDNASEDGTKEWLTKLAATDPEVRVIFNETNAGFATANNQAFEGASGEVFCLLNNDTVVTPGWLWELVRAVAEQPDVGLAGPSTNGAANEAFVEAGYRTLGELPQWSEEFTWSHDGKRMSIPMLALFCAALRRRVWEEMGGLDERFGTGMFEDDDFSRRLRYAGYEVHCLQSAYVHHFQQATFRDMDTDVYVRLYEENREKLRQKWRRTGRRLGAGAARAAEEGVDPHLAHEVGSRQPAQRSAEGGGSAPEYDSSSAGNVMRDHLSQVLKYRDLLRLLIVSNLTSRYKRSILGVLWTLLNPLLTMTVMTIAFSTLFKFSLPHYPVYVLSGIVLWTFFQQTTMQSMNSLVFGSGLLKKVYVPAGVFPLSAIGTGVVNIWLSLLPIVIIMVVLHHPFKWALVFVPFAVALVALFALGVGLTISMAAVFFSDVAEMYGVVLRIWFYLTPVMYPEEILPPKFLWVVKLNPMYHLMLCWREPMYHGVLPPAHSVLVSAFWAGGAVVAGWWVFSRRSYEFALRA